MSRFVTRVLVSLAAASAFSLSISGTARADNPGRCAVTSISLDGRLMVDCGGNTYYAFSEGGGNCGNSPMDRIKVWESMAMSAMLSGKQLEVYYTIPSGCSVRIFTWMRVNN
jgi:hypothetical protein